MTPTTRLLAVLALALTAGCVFGRDPGPRRTSETNIELSHANFVNSKVHVVGEVTKHYVFFIGVAGPPDVHTAAWEAVRESAEMEGRAAQFVNVTQEQSTRWFLPPFYYQKVFTVSADVVRFKTPRPGPPDSE